MTKKGIHVHFSISVEQNTEVLIIVCYIHDILFFDRVETGVLGNVLKDGMFFWHFYEMSSVVVKCYPLLEGFEDLSQNEDLNVIIYCSAVESKSGESSDEDEDNMEAG